MRRPPLAPLRPLARLALLALLALPAPLAAQGIRERIRTAPRATTVTESQANELTLTLTKAEVRPIQVWVRAAGPVDGTGQRITASVPKVDAAFIKAGQRVRAFPPEARSSMYQARVDQVVPKGDRVDVTITLIAPGRPGSSIYVLEIVTELGDLLSVPNEAIIETGEKRLVYVQDAAGGYVQRQIQPGVQGELFTQIVDGLKPGEQVVTFGSFFIDADFKLKGS